MSDHFVRAIGAYEPERCTANGPPETDPTKERPHMAYSSGQPDRRQRGQDHADQHLTASASVILRHSTSLHTVSSSLAIYFNKVGEFAENNKVAQYQCVTLIRPSTTQNYDIFVKLS
ncbi:hypothetical protein INT43_008696 [Umbelopsis isabellina]|uniref:Uncharacterized protein n=1 Tax=Mortierella isabellina TaxID=91625 RepID=A0A8H7PX75_MORIS|nr:hypothetical protein INT43_008696 [Umbelopsis isabellina]